MKIRCKNVQVVRMNVLKAERKNTKRHCQVCQTSQKDANSADNMKETSDKVQKLCRIKENITGKVFRKRIHLAIVLVILMFVYLQYD